MLKDCDSCLSAPSSVYCRAESAVLCTACDADIHSMNLIFHRHHRVPLLVYPGEDLYDDDAEGNNCDYEALFGEEVDEYLDLGEYNSGLTADQDQKQQQQHGFNLNLECVKSEGSECVVPVQQRLLCHNDEHHHQQVEFDDGFRYVASLSHKVPLAAIETNSIVPDTTTTTDISTAHIRPSKGTIELFSGPPLQMPTQFSPMDREARVLRYREKKKNRKFEKMIRYASRKAYAEARPRIKGRFAKRSEVVHEVDQMFSNYVVSDDGGYGIVPSF